MRLQSVESLYTHLEHDKNKTEPYDGLKILQLLFLLIVLFDKSYILHVIIVQSPYYKHLKTPFTHFLH